MTDTSPATQPSGSPRPGETLPRSASLTHRVATGAAWGALSRIAVLAAQLISMPILARLLSRPDFGIINMSATFLYLANALADFGLSAWVMQRNPLTKHDEDVVRSTAWLVGGSAAVAGLVAAVPLSRFYGEPRLAGVVASQSLVYLLTSAALVHNAVGIRDLAFERINAGQLTGTIVSFVSTLALAWAGAGYWSVVVGRALQAAAFLAIIVPRGGRILPRRVSATAMKPIFRFGLGFTVIGAISQFCENVDNATVGRLFGAAQLGLYAVSYNLASLPQKYGAFMLAGIANPIVARATPGEPLAAALQRCVRYQILFPAASAAAIGVFAQEVCAVLLGSRWPDAPALVRITAVSGAMLSVQTVIHDTLLNRGYLSSLVRYHLVKVAATTALVIAGAHFGLSGVAKGLAAANTLTLSSGLVFLSVRLGLAPLRVVSATIRPMAVVAGATLAAVGAKSALAGSGLHGLPLLLEGSAAFLFALVALLRILCVQTWFEIKEGVQALLARSHAKRSGEP